MRTIHHKQDDGMETDDLTRGETATSLYLYLMQGREIPEPVRKRYGFDEDYRMLQRINGMDHDVYERKRLASGLPDAAMVEARLTRSVERAFESLCRRPPDDYLEMLDRELETLGAMAGPWHGPRTAKEPYSVGRISLPNTALIPVARAGSSSGRLKRHTGNWMRVVSA